MTAENAVLLDSVTAAGSKLVKNICGLSSIKGWAIIACDLDDRITENVMNQKMLLGAVALTLSGASFAAEPAPSAPKMECCCKKGEDGKMECCKDDAKDAEKKSGHEGHDMGGMDHK